MADGPTSPLPPNRSGYPAAVNTMTPPGVKPKDFTEIAIERGYCTAEQIKQALDEHKRQNSSEDLTVFLVKLGVLTQQQARACERATRGATVIAGFEILEKVGQGGMGAVFRARQISMDRVVALKILPPKLAQDPVFKQRFLHEAKLSAKLSHLNIINGIDCGEQGGYTFFAMEFVDGKTVKQVLKEKGRLTPEEAFKIVYQVVEALVYAETHRLVHRDIKPDNIMLTSTGVAKLCDLGLAKQNEKTEDASLTQAGQAVGTPHYISPEQARGEKNVDTRSDIYSLGGTFYHMLTGKTPFDAPTGAAVMALHITDEAKNPCDTDPAIPVSYGEIISKMMAKAAADRYTNAIELLADMDLAKNNGPIKAAGFKGKSSCAMPRRTAAVGRNTTGPQAPVSERRTLTGTGRHIATRPAASGLIAFAMIAVLGTALWYLTKGAPAVKKPDVPQPTAKKDEPPPVKEVAQIPDPPKDKPPEIPPEKKPEVKTPDPKPPVETVVVPDEKPVKKPEKKPDVAPEVVGVTSKALPPAPVEMEEPEMKLTADMLYARFLSEMRKLTEKGDLQKAQADIRDLSNKSEFSPARSDLNAELADFQAAIAFEQEAMKNKAATGGMVDLNEDTAKKWETSKGKIIGYDSGRGLSVEINVKGNKLQLYVPAASLPLADILKVAPDQSAAAQMKYLCARGNYADADALKEKLKETEKPRWERKLKLAKMGERELQAYAAFENLEKVASAKSWKTFTKMAADFDKSYADTMAATENIIKIVEWKSEAKAALTIVDNLEASGKFAPIKLPTVNTTKVSVKKHENGNKVLHVGSSGEDGFERGGVAKVELPPVDLSSKKEVVIQTKLLEGNPLQMSIGFMCGDKYFESQPAQVKPGEAMEHVFKLDEAVFKMPIAEPEGTYSKALEGHEKTLMFFIIFITKQSYEIELDAIRFR
ncbi:MAG TPA: protein kinase [Planctomycetota bacterium]|nr:protein kinase [Planctomycetota bacterium]